MKPVSLQNITPGQAAEMVQEVFHEQGFITAKANFSRVVLERKGSGWDNVAYGNWMQDSQMWVRVKVDINRVGEMGLKLDCSAFYVRGRNELIEEEIKIHKMGKYQELLDEVARRLHQPREKR